MKLITLFIALIVSTVANAQTIRMTPPQSKFDASHDYFHGLLTMALDATVETDGAYNIEFSNVLQQGRAIRELKANRTIDLYFAGTDLTRERDLRAIRIPLTKGILGYRGLVIRQDKKGLFDNIKSETELKSLIACQGMHWPDSDILEANGFKVQRLAVYEQMFDMVNKGHCDYFPRGMHEGQVEVDARQERLPELMFYKDLIVQYPFPMYFFTSKENEDLAKRIEKGLMSVIGSGEFEKYMQQHETTQHLYPLAEWLDNRIIQIENPLLPIDTPLHDAQLWLQPN